MTSTHLIMAKMFVAVPTSVKVNADDRLPVIQTPNRLSTGTLYNHPFAILWGKIIHGSDSEAYRTISCSLI